MVARKFFVRYNDSDLEVDYDTDDGFEVFKFQLFSLTSIPPDEQKIFGGDDDRLVLDDYDLVSISDRLLLVSAIDEVEERKLAHQNAELAKSDEELARMLQAEEEALMFQQLTVSEDKSQIERQIRPYINQVLMYEDSKLQESARMTVSIEKLEEKALVSLAKEGNFKPTKSEQDHAFLLQLLFWFKTSFRWVNAPSCDGCGGETISNGMGVALPSETLYGASRVELYRCLILKQLKKNMACLSKFPTPTLRRCNICSTITRFPRYNDPSKLLETRRGRCGEWANCFTLYCRAFGYESRFILDFTDHVWTECFSPFLGRWMHLDPCEGIYDNPLLYEKGWGKSLNYVIAIAKDGVYDVTKRYTRKWHEVLSRRHFTTEPVLCSILSNIRRECRQNFTTQVVAALEERDRNEEEALERDLHSKDDSSIALPGRQSGDKDWRISRSEFGSDENCSLSSSSCPVRKCIDEHVTKIYNAFCPVILQFAEKSYSKSKAIEVLKIFRQILVNLKNSPFRTRRTSVNSVSNASLLRQILPCFGQLLDAVSLKSELDASGRTDICLAADPVKTSIALPVLFHALDDAIHNVNKCDNISKNSLSWPLLKLNRICSCLVRASGEELPFGIVTSAFDGTRMSKWEEPNGAKGCWVVYKVLENQMHELVAYELMSANDAPERDPMDWVLEGSDNGGSTWRLLDKQTSHTFENRFERSTFEIRSVRFPANAFRFRFLAVRDGNATSRFQVGSIDLYASS